MHTSRILLRRLALPGLLFTFGVSGYAQNDTRQGQQRNQQEAQSRDQQEDSRQSLQQKQVKIFEGKVTAKWNRYFLEDPLRHTSYQLDDGWKAKKFLGQQVRVTGTFDSDKNIIYIRAIAKRV